MNWMPMTRSTVINLDSQLHAAARGHAAERGHPAAFRNSVLRNSVSGKGNRQDIRLHWIQELDLMLDFASRKKRAERSS